MQRRGERTDGSHGLFPQTVNYTWDYPLQHNTHTHHSLFSLDGVHRSHVITGNVAAAPGGE